MQEGGVSDEMQLQGYADGSELPPSNDCLVDPGGSHLRF